MKFTNLLTVGALAASLVSPAIMAADTNNTTPMSDAQKKKLKK